MLFEVVSIVLGIQSKNKRCHQKFIYKGVHQNLIFTVIVHHLSLMPSIAPSIQKNLNKYSWKNELQEKSWNFPNG